MTATSNNSKVRNLIVVFGDQLNRDASAFDDFDPNCDAVWMAEVEEESTHVWTHKQRIALFLSAMRHFRDALVAEEITVLYTQLDDAKRRGENFSDQLRKDLRESQPDRVIATLPGEWRVKEALERACDAEKVALDVREDRHFFTTAADFRDHAEGRKSLRMEYFYRELRKRFDILMEDGKPLGGDWNYDKENRGSFGKDGPDAVNSGPNFSPDAVTRAVIDLVEERFAKHPGSLDSFAWAVTPADAERALKEFIEKRLPSFGQYQDALWTDEPWLYHSLLSSSLNLKLLDPRKVVEAAEAAYHVGDAPLPAVEGFIRQILGWREYVRSIYWMKMPEYIKRNELDADGDLPDFYWTGKTDLVCLQQAIGQTLEHGYAHHIQRLMVTGLYTLLLGVDPRKVHEWYLAVYVDAVEWVELPNTLGMSQYGDGGLMASKPYVATGNYINKMSNYCRGCPRNPKKRIGDDACPFTTLYWDFLLRHETKMRKNQRMSLQIRNIDRIDAGERREITDLASRIRENPAVCYSEKLL